MSFNKQGNNKIQNLHFCTQYDMTSSKMLHFCFVCRLFFNDASVSQRATDFKDHLKDEHGFTNVGTP